jgi:Family of unknown function (DUF6496)
MSKKSPMARAREDARVGKSPSTQAGEFVREEFHHIREGIHGARSTRQAIAIGLSKARRAGVKLPPPKAEKATPDVRRQAKRDYAKGQQGGNHPSLKRSRATLSALKREEKSAASPLAISRQARAGARKITARERSAAAQKRCAPKALPAAPQPPSKLRKPAKRIRFYDQET